MTIIEGWKSKYSSSTDSFTIEFEELANLMARHYYDGMLDGKTADIIKTGYLNLHRIQEMFKLILRKDLDEAKDIINDESPRDIPT
jgi:hypothetical protein